MTVLYFTSTGNCLYVAKRIGGTLLSIPQLLKNGPLTVQDDVLGLVIPCYALGIPGIVRRFLSQATLSAGYTFAIITYGSKSGAAARDLQKAAAASGLTFDYISYLQMVDNYLPAFKMESEVAGLPTKGTEAALERILIDLSGHTKQLPTITGADRMLSSAFQKGFWTLNNGSKGKTYRIDDRCTRCGICAKVCPTGNIVVNAAVDFGDRCEVCLACVHACPTNALHMEKEKGAARFRNPNVTLQEIVEANMQ